MNPKGRGTMSSSPFFSEEIVALRATSADGHTVLLVLGGYVEGDGDLGCCTLWIDSKEMREQKLDSSEVNFHSKWRETVRRRIEAQSAWAMTPRTLLPRARRAR